MKINVNIDINEEIFKNIDEDNLFTILKNIPRDKLMNVIEKIDYDDSDWYILIRIVHYLNKTIKNLEYEVNDAYRDKEFDKKTYKLFKKFINKNKE